MKRSRRLLAQAAVVLALGAVYLALPADADAAALGCDLDQCISSCIDADWNACLGCGQGVSFQCNYDPQHCELGESYREFCGFAAEP